MRRKLIMQGALVLAALLALTACTSEKSTSSLLLGGDVFLARAGEPLFESTADPWGDALAVKEEFEQSFFVVNLESPLGIAKSAIASDPSMNLCAPPATVDVLSRAGIDLVTTANNHAQDCLDADSITMTKTLDEAGINHTGGQGEVATATISGRTIAFVTLNDVSGSYELDSILQQVQRADAENDLVVISVHWGIEYQAGPTTRQRELAASLVEAGADIIWGHHPHVLQPMEWMHSMADGHDALVLYSLGNLLSDQWMLPDTQKTVLVNIDFNDEGIRKITLIPVRMDMSSEQLIFPQNENEITWWKSRLNFDEVVTDKVEISICLPTEPQD